MSEIQPRTVSREEFNRELVQALDDLVADARHHGELIKASFERSVTPALARETSPPYGEIPERLERVEGRLERVEGRLDQVDGRLSGIDGRLDRIERTLTEIRERMATKVELEETNDNVKKMADGYMTIGKRLDAVADLLKLRVVAP